MKKPDLQHTSDSLRIEELLKDGEQHEQRGEAELAYESYCQAAQLGSARAMFSIGALYAFKAFRQKEETNMMDLLREGKPIFPWNLVTRKVPDFKTALSWFLKGAKLDDGHCAYLAGVMLCQGMGGKAEPEKGLALLEQAQELGVAEAKNMLLTYRPAKKAEYTDEEYERLLSSFCAAADAGDERSHELYAQLKGGSEKQLARLGYVLCAAGSMQKPHYGVFQALSTPSGIPLIPACAKRSNWKTFIHVDLNAFGDENTLLALSSDLDTDSILGVCQRLRPVGKARYRSPAFGWLAEEKHACLFQIDRSCMPTEEALEQVIRSFHLIPEEYQTENSAFITECGEKEYSVEIAAITDRQVDILFRYTIDGTTEVDACFEPELISLDLEA